ncbi:MAG: hypothetical protein EBR82_65330 [Caulobacteraceae bacterium]|nr:hypothetical protein [Caulobacteraceae bacterium]
MKKSEMVKALMEKFNHVFIGVHAEPIIDFLEGKGMLPPKRIKYAPTACSEPNRKIVYEWEDEVPSEFTQQTIDDALEHIGKKGVRGSLEIRE